MLGSSEIFFNFVPSDLERTVELSRRLSAEGYGAWLRSAKELGTSAYGRRLAETKPESMILIAVFSKARAHQTPSTADESLELLLPKLPKSQFVPLRVEPCEVPPFVRPLVYAYVDLFRDGGWERLLSTLGPLLTPAVGEAVPPPGLVEACVKNTCVLYAGAGLSARAGYPTWPLLVRDLLDWAAGERVLPSPTIHSLAAAAEAGELDLVADSIVRALGPKTRSRLYRYLETVFASSKSEPSDVHRLLRKLGFSAVLTTNFDSLLEHTFSYDPAEVLTPGDTEALLAALAAQRFFLVKLYGRLDDPDSVLVSPSQFEDAVVGNRAFYDFIESLFVSRPILFLGCSLEGIEGYLEGIRFRGKGQEHYALVAVKGVVWEAKASVLEERYGIHVIPYQEVAGHAAFLAFIERLVRDVSEARGIAQRPAKGGSRAPLEPAKGLIRSVRLVNVGPFRDEELDLDPSWNLLLGDNGVGKTCVLRAIALAFCGTDGEKAAGRLLRSGASSGRIVVETERESYTTELHSTSSGVKVESRPRRPLEPEGWLVIGFPALRSVSWRPARALELDDSRARPLTDDLLPLLMGEPDPRMDELKDWIVSVDQGSAVSGRSEDGSARQVRGEVFGAIREITESGGVEFVRVTENRRVLVSVEGDQIPLEAISQGMASLFGWVGVLLRRLNRIYGGGSSARERRAVVLLDEIDAHMHPGWQQVLVTHLKERFPGVQFLATTHSPLVIGGLEGRQVFQFERDPLDTRQIRVGRIRGSLKGWRADQLLTMIFGLKSARDPGTQDRLLGYTRLAALEERSPGEEEKMRELAGELNIRLPGAAEREESREAFHLINRALQKEWEGVPRERRERIIEEMKVQLQEMMTGSRRPT